VIARHRDMVDERVAAGIDQANASPRGVGEPIPLARFRRNRLIRNTSSGSTGTPTVFYEDGARTAMSWALDLRHRRWFGVLPGAREARMLRGRRDLKAASRIPGMRELLWNQLMLPGTNLTDADYRLCVQELQRFQPRVLWGFTSAWVGLAEFLRRDGGLTGDWRPAMINTWAAPLYEHEERVLAEVFGCPVTNVYGSREIGHVAACCPEKRLHVHADQVLVEIDEPAGDPPVGELLCTTLSPNIMPFIRYRMGDLGRVGATPCPCGRTLPVLEDFLGRTGEVFHTRDGRMISPNFWCRTFMNPALGGKVHRFQVLYRRDGGITMQIVQGPGYDNTAEHTIRSHVESSLGPATPLTFQYPDDIPPTTSGKYLMVRREEA
jgi:phenylacetate-CoA ligase